VKCLGGVGIVAILKDFSQNGPEYPLSHLTGVSCRFSTPHYISCGIRIASTSSLRESVMHIRSWGEILRNI